MKRAVFSLFSTMVLAAGLGVPTPSWAADASRPSSATARVDGDVDVDASIDLFDAMEQGLVEAKFVAKSSLRGRIIMENKTDQPLHVEIPEAFIGVPAALAQFGGGGGGGGGLGGGGLGGGGGQQQSVGGGGGGGRGGGRGGGGGGLGGGGRGGGRGAFSIPPEKIARVDVDLLCLNHGLREPSSSKPYVIRPIEDFISDPAVIELVTAYGYGELPTAAAQAAVWHLNSGVSWPELAAKLTGTERHLVRESYFSRDQIAAGVEIAVRARQLGASREVKPRNLKLPSEQLLVDEETSPGDVASGEANGGVAERGDEATVEVDDDAPADAPADAPLDPSGSSPAESPN